MRAYLAFLSIVASLSLQGAMLIPLGDLPGGSFASYAYGVSDDGSVLVGYSDGANGPEAYRWTQAGGMLGLGDLPGGFFSSEALGVSHDGSAVVGFGLNANNPEAFRWTVATGMVGLGNLPGDLDRKSVV